jgi:hypothetical protein
VWWISVVLGGYFLGADSLGFGAFVSGVLGRIGDGEVVDG